MGLKEWTIKNTFGLHGKKNLKPNQNPDHYLRLPKST